MADRLRFRFRLMLGRSIAVGPGKADLLAAIEQTGSISAAARTMGMSYKRAWLLIDTMNRCFRHPVVDTETGGRSHGGATLTATGRDILARYRRMEVRAAEALAADLEALEALTVDEPSD